MLGWPVSWVGNPGFQKSLILFRSIRKLLKHFNSNVNYIPEEAVNDIVQRSSSLDQVWDNFYLNVNITTAPKHYYQYFYSKIIFFLIFDLRQLVHLE